MRHRAPLPAGTVVTDLDHLPNRPPRSAKVDEAFRDATVALTLTEKFALLHAGRWGYLRQPEVAAYLALPGAEEQLAEMTRKALERPDLTTTEEAAQSCIDLCNAAREEVITAAAERLGWTVDHTRHVLVHGDGAEHPTT